MGIFFLFVLPFDYTSDPQELSGIVSIFALSLSSIYLELAGKEIFSNHRLFIPFRISHIMIFRTDLVRFFRKASFLVPLLILTLVINGKFPHLREKFGLVMFNVQALLSTLAGVTVLIFVYHSHKALSNVFNPFIILFRGFIWIFAVVYLDISSYSIPFGGMFFLGFLTNYSNSVCLSINLLLMGIFLLLCAFCATWIYKRGEKWRYN